MREIITHVRQHNESKIYKKVPSFNKISPRKYANSNMIYRKSYANAVPVFSFVQSYLSISKIQNKKKFLNREL